MRMGELFAGIGGFSLGFRRAGFDVAWQVEIEPYCRKVLEKNFPEAERFNDVREVGKHNLSPVDVICGGFPCQDISNAGKRAGIEGERSGLWSEFARIIGELRPPIVVVENVAALLVRGVDRVLGDLAALGYDAEWEVISAADIGAPHLRRRLWIAAYPSEQRWAGCRVQCDRFDGEEGDDRKSALVRVDTGSREVSLAHAPRILEGWQEQWTQRERARESGESIASDAYIFPPIRAAIARGECGQWEPEPNVGRVAHGVPARVDRLKALGNAVVPQIPELIARRILEAAA